MKWLLNILLALKVRYYAPHLPIHTSLQFLLCDWFVKGTLNIFFYKKHESITMQRGWKASRFLWISYLHSVTYIFNIIKFSYSSKKKSFKKKNLSSLINITIPLSDQRSNNKHVTWLMETEGTLATFNERRQICCDRIRSSLIWNQSY